MQNTDIRITSYESLISSKELQKKIPTTKEVKDKITESRRIVNNIINHKDDRILAIVGPCSIHDPKAAIEYAKKLKEISDKISDKIFVVMRTYFEKPRTVGGWKGLIIDPDIDGSYNIEKGLYIARSLLIDIIELGLPVGCEVLDPVVPQYIDELMSWSAIGARTTESQTHRNLSSGLSVAVGFKNSTNGDISNAINAIKSAALPAAFIGVDRDGNTSVIRTSGNELGHLILRGGNTGPNYYDEKVEEAREKLIKNGVNPSIIVDCSHANSGKKAYRQKRVLRNIIDQINYNEKSIRGFMIESNLEQGSQKITEDLDKLKYGVSITDECISIKDTREILLDAYNKLSKENV
ncbi:MAG: 3-deoxy-7-phosphoheptulonate synthase [Pleomorphochaeta sp.]